jgi:hypothetical protein
VIYYGDEIGMAGATDPDSRRVLPDVLAPSSLPPLQSRLLDQISRLSRARQCSRSLRRAPRQLLFVDADRDGSLHGEALVVLSRAKSPSTVRVGVSGRFREVLSGASLVLPPGGALPVPARGVAVWLAENDRCAAN